MVWIGKIFLLIMLKLKVAKEAINNGLNEIVKNSGFQLRKSNSEFILSNLNADYIYYLIYTKWSSHISITPYAYIRNKTIEQIYGKIINEKRKSNWTLGSDISTI